MQKDQATLHAIEQAKSGLLSKETAEEMTNAKPSDATSNFKLQKSKNSSMGSMEKEAQQRNA